ncbi:MAG: cysteinyl-tRNA synthetase, partial [Myxococcota bacterium]
MRRFRHILIMTTAWLLAADASADISSWAYQLQNYDAATLRQTSVDLMVVDIDELARTPVSVQTLKQRNAHVVSYLSVGEAENYRAYWQSSWAQQPPSWLDSENPRWRGNFRVRFWTRGWRALMVAAVQKIARAGYDGVYLDTIDTYTFYQNQGHAHAREAMIRLVAEVSEAGRAINPGFMVIAQNAPELSADSDYLELLDGAALEDTFYNGDSRISSDDVRWTLDQVQRFKAAGRFVLSVDYPTRFGAVRDYCSKA